jgi:hypothetical protein
LQFDSGAAAYKLEDYNKALESFSQALLSPDTGLQGKSHYNLGNTLYQRGEAQKTDDKKIATGQMHSIITNKRSSSNPKTKRRRRITIT